jgi:hypothetical protein
MRTRSLLFLLALLALLALAPVKAEATTYSSWYSFTDQRGLTDVPCRWRVAADVQYPAYGATYTATYGGGTYAIVPHSSYNYLLLEALSPSGLGTSYYTLTGDLRRWDTGANWWVFFDEVVLSGYYPPYEGPLSYTRGFRNPYSSTTTYWYDTVYVSPVGEAHYCDATMSATAHEQGYRTISVMDRNPYFVRP